MENLDSLLFPPSLKEAKAIQSALAEKVCLKDRFDPINWVGGMDQSNQRFDPKQMVYAATVVLDQKTGSVIDRGVANQSPRFPYIPGFLGFREAPVLVASFQQLSKVPQLIFVDGHGISHPRRLGIASHIGVLLDVPTIGVAKSILVGRPAGELGEEPGSLVPLIWKNEVIAMVLRTKRGARPLIISAGHRICLETAVLMVRSWLKGYRLPEPTRQAHLGANAYRKSF
jgi:deoxyribonuclease V